MKAAVVIDLPDLTRERMDAVAEHYDLPADLLAKKFLVDVINSVFEDTVLALKKQQVEP